MIALINLSKDVAMHVQRHAINHTNLKIMSTTRSTCDCGIESFCKFSDDMERLCTKMQCSFDRFKELYRSCVYITNVILVGEIIQTMVAVLIVQIIITEGIILTKRQALVLYVIVADIGTKFQCALYFLVVLYSCSTKLVPLF